MDKNHESMLRKVIDYILGNLNSDVSLQRLSKIGHYSPSYLQRVFLRYLNISPKQLVKTLRLELALNNLIVENNLTLKQIAFDCGFEHLSSFSRSVKDYTGTSPHKLRDIDAIDCSINSSPILIDWDIEMIELKEMVGISKLINYQNDKELNNGVKTFIKKGITPTIKVDLYAVTILGVPNYFKLMSTPLESYNSQSTSNEKTLSGLFAKISVYQVPIRSINEIVKKLRKQLARNGYMVANLEYYIKLRNDGHIVELPIVNFDILIPVIHCH